MPKKGTGLHSPDGTTKLPVIRWDGVSQCSLLYPFFIYQEQKPRVWGLSNILHSHPGLYTQCTLTGNLQHAYRLTPSSLLWRKLSSGYAPLGSLVRSGLLCGVGGTGRDLVPSHTQEVLRLIFCVHPSPERQLWFQTSAHFAQWPYTLRA